MFMFPSLVHNNCRSWSWVQPLVMQLLCIYWPLRYCLIFCLGAFQVVLESGHWNKLIAFHSDIIISKVTFVNEFVGCGVNR